MMAVKIVEVTSAGSREWSTFHCEGQDEDGKSRGMIKVEARSEAAAMAIAMLEFDAAERHSEPGKSITLPELIRLADGSDRQVVRQEPYGVEVTYHANPASGYTLDCLHVGEVSFSGVMSIDNQCDGCRKATIRWSGVGNSSYRIAGQSSIWITVPMGAARGWIVSDSPCPED